MPLDTALPTIPLLTFVLGLGAGTLVWHWRSRRHRPDSATTGELQTQIERLIRAQDASEQANSELKQALDQMEQAAGTDRLTGAWNRRRFQDAVARLLALSSRRSDDICLLLFDLDRFKQVNDTFGHAAGDLMLKSVARVAQEQLRASDALVRWGGEEFLILSPATTLAGATTLAEKIRQAIEITSVPQAGGVTVSLGVAQHLNGETVEDWIARTDAALYRAKKQGRNRVETSLETEGHPALEPSSVLVLQWDPALECGHPVIDHQHQELYQLANNLLATMTGGHYPEDAKLQMQMLLARLAQHFRDEEEVLSRIDYPSLAAHAQEHARLLAKAKALQPQMTGVSADLPALLSFVALDLVRDHLTTWDRDFFPFLRKP